MQWTITALFLTFCHGSILVRGDNNGDAIVCPRAVNTIDNNSKSLTKLDYIDPNGKRFSEVSGLVFSPTQVGPSGKPLIFVINDSGGGERIGMFDSGTGKRLLTLQLQPGLTRNRDWESLAIGSCGYSNNETCLYIADIGDNTARGGGGSRTGRSTTYQILKLREPMLKAYRDNERDVTILPFNYGHKTSPTRYADSEGIFLDHVGWGKYGTIGDIYLVTKWDSAKARTLNRIFKIPVSAWQQANSRTMLDTYSPRAVGTYLKADGTPVGGRFMNGLCWTRADMSLDGTIIALGDVYATYLFLRCPGASVAEALVGVRGCHSWKNPSIGGQQYETFAWAPDGISNLQLAEGAAPLFGWTTMEYDSTLEYESQYVTIKACPKVAWREMQNSSAVQCRTVKDGIPKPGAWCEAALALSSADKQSSDSPAAVLVPNQLGP